MQHELFGQITAPSVRITRSPYTIVISIAAHVALIGVVVIAPLMAVGALPRPAPVEDIFIQTTPMPPPLPAAPIATTRRGDPPERNADVPLAEPEGIQDEAPPQGVIGTPSLSETVGSSDGVPGGLGSDGTRGSMPSPPIQPQPPAGPVQIGGKIREPRRVFSVAPIYPAIARQARVQGTVVIQAVIGVDGAVRDTQVQISVPLLDQAALDAVRQWRYQPTLLNGVPVAVIMTVSVRFTLQ